MRKLFKTLIILVILVAVAGALGPGPQAADARMPLSKSVSAAFGIRTSGPSPSSIPAPAGARSNGPRNATVR